MKSKYQINEIKAVVLYILQHFKDGVDYIKLFKIMYFAQREYLATYGVPLVEDTFKARQLGPVPSLTYKVVKMAEAGDKSVDLDDFISSIRVDESQKIYAAEKPDTDYLAEAEEKKLDKIIAEYSNVDSKKLSELSHDTAYLAVCERMKDDPQKDILTLIDIARAGGASDEMIGCIREDQLIKEALSC